MRTRWHAGLWLGATAIAAGGVAWPASAQVNPRAKPLDRTPYQFDDDAAPTLTGLYIGLAFLFVAVVGISYELRRRRRREALARWMAVHPGGTHPGDGDPWLAADAIDEARTRIAELDAALAARADLRIDRRARIRADVVAEFEPAAGEDARVVVRIEAATRHAELRSSWLQRRSRRRRFAEFWTLSRRGVEWELMTSEPDHTAPRRLALHGAPPWGRSGPGPGASEPDVTRP